MTLGSVRNTILCVGLSLAPAWAQTGRVETAKVRPAFAWPEAGQDARVGSSITKGQVEEFLTTAYAKLYASEAVKVQQFGFVRLWPGRATLVATIAGGRDMYFTLEAVDFDGSQSYVRFLPADPPYDLNAEVVDVDGDGVSEILTSKLAGGYQGASTKPVTWKRVLKARLDHSFEDVSIKNRAYYERRIIPELDITDSGLEERYTLGPDLDEAKAAVQLVRFKYRRMLYGEQNAGLETAQAWTVSPNSGIRRLAVEVLSDINTDAAREILTRVSYSNDRIVAGAAKRALEKPALK